MFKPGVVYHVDYGGRGGAKTWTWADAVIVEACLRPVRILVTREFQISIEESIKDEIEEAIYSRGLEHFFTMTKTSIVGRNGSKLIFKGIKNNIKNLKSISNVDIVLCEESENIQKDSWEKLLPSIRPKSGLDPIFIILFNPDNELDDTYQRWVISPPDDCVSIKVNYIDNKYFPSYLEKQRLHCKKTQPMRTYRHIWEGFPTGAEGDVIMDLEWIKAARFASHHEDFVQSGIKKVSYDPAGQGRDSNAVVYQDGNIVKDIDEWVRSDDLREASNRAFDMATDNAAGLFTFDTCGGLGDGVDVFITDRKKEKKLKTPVFPFDAGAPVVNGKKTVNGTNRTWANLYTNAKAQAHAVTAQKFYNTFRFIKLGERDISPEDMISVDIADNGIFNKLARELSTPVWEKSDATSKKKVEDKKKMKKRTGQESPNIADALIMNNAPQPTGNRIHIG
ncbi:MAG: PBSX family phage terminase large subunit [Gammaproteobacteria bacterium]|nr:PBSX family phage terminase large subunit [Gammaproteobacteria bacterium]